MTPPRVLIACERSGVVRREFLALGFDAWSCDIEPADDGNNRHITGDVLGHLDDGWDLLAVMHPPCTVLCNSGVKHLYIGGRKENGRNEARWSALHHAAEFYRTLRDAPMPRSTRSIACWRSPRSMTTGLTGAPATAPSPPSACAILAPTRSPPAPSGTPISAAFSRHARR